MPNIYELIQRMRRQPNHVRFKDADRVARFFFGLLVFTALIMCSTRLGRETRASISKIARASSPHTK